MVFQKMKIPRVKVECVHVERQSLYKYKALVNPKQNKEINKTLLSLFFSNENHRKTLFLIVGILRKRLQSINLSSCFLNRRVIANHYLAFSRDTFILSQNIYVHYFTYKLFR